MRPVFSRITVLMLSPMLPRCTGMCGALAIRLPAASNSAQLKSSRSLMLTEYAVFCSCSPICSAMFMNRLLNTSSSTGSTVVPAANVMARGTRRSSTRWSSPVSSASQPGSTTVVAFFSTMMAGPVTTSPGRRSSRTTSAVSCHRPPEYTRTVSRFGTSRGACTAWRGSAGASPATTASTDTASTTSRLPCIRKAKRWRYAASKPAVMAAVVASRSAGPPQASDVPSGGSEDTSVPSVGRSGNGTISAESLPS